MELVLGYSIITTSPSGCTADHYSEVVDSTNIKSAKIFYDVEDDSAYVTVFLKDGSSVFGKVSFHEEGSEELCEFLKNNYPTHVGYGY